MTTQTQLDAILDKWNLLNHPFYQAWSAGTLSVEALQTYAREYGNFIETLPLGWETLHDDETANEESEHAGMWRSFTVALGTRPDAAAIQQSKHLAQIAATLFADAPTALGALYAFEIQQPATAKSKLEGLQNHYQLPASVEPYFKSHAANWHESEKILRQINALPEAKQAAAVAACEQMASSLWDALTGIYEETCN